MILFKNRGEIDVDAMVTFGINVKDVDNPIGYFGTGLKYAIAVLLREGCEITIYSGDTRYHFEAVEKLVRGQPFSFVHMRKTYGDSQQLGFTTDLGKNWELWMAYRELYCNTIDEKGDVRELRPEQGMTSEEGYTKVYVEGKAFREVHEEREKFLLLDKPVVEVGKEATAHLGRTSSIFYRGIRVHQVLMAECLYTYDVTRNVDLTEDRTLKWKHQADFAIARMIMKSTNKDFLRNVLSCGKGFYEYEINFMQLDTEATDEFYEVVHELREDKFDLEMNPSAVLLHARRVTTSVLPTKSITLNDIQSQQMIKAKAFVHSVLGCDMHKFPIVILETLGGGCLGRAEQGKIFLSAEVFNQGTKRVAAALYEEYVHLDTGVKDETLEQKWIYLQKILTLGEQLNGEPL